MDPYNVPFNVMEDWYRAYNRFSSLIRDERYGYRFALNPGKNDNYF